MSAYQAIPVEEARALSVKFSKAVVIINAWDAVHEKLHTTTYGTEPRWKIAAAQGGETCAKALGMDMDKAAFNEDFRTVDAARNAQLRDIVLRNLPALERVHKIMANELKRAL